MEKPFDKLFYEYFANNIVYMHSVENILCFEYVIMKILIKLQVNIVEDILWCAILIALMVE